MDNNREFNLGTDSMMSRNNYGLGGSSNRQYDGHGPGPQQSFTRSIYGAFEDFERAARHRKYLIAELEDTIENLEKIMEDIVQNNKALEVQCEKLEMEAIACEATYAKDLKEKDLIESEYNALSKEMDLMTEEITRKKAQCKQIEAFRIEKLDLICKTEEKFMNEYKKNPVIAEKIEHRVLCDDLETEVHEKTKELDLLSKELHGINNRYTVEWEAFGKRCLNIAEVYVNLKDKTAVRDSLQIEVDKMMFRSPIFTPRRISSSIPSSRMLEKSTTPRDNFMRRTSDIGPTSTKPRRSSAFQQMDRVLNQSSLRNAGCIRKYNVKNPREYVPMSASMRGDSSLVSQLRTRLKGTVMVNPMPRNPEIQPSEPLNSLPFSPSPFSLPKSPDKSQQSHFDLFGSSTGFNIGSSPPQKEGAADGFDFFGGLFGSSDQNSQQSSGSDGAYTFSLF